MHQQLKCTDISKWRRCTRCLPVHVHLHVTSSLTSFSLLRMPFRVYRNPLSGENNVCNVSVCNAQRQRRTCTKTAQLFVFGELGRCTTVQFNYYSQLVVQLRTCAMFPFSLMFAFSDNWFRKPFCACLTF